MGYQHLPIDALATGQGLSGAVSNALVYSDGTGLLATVATLSYSSSPGYVGIGTSAPTAKLHLSGAQNSPAAFGVSGVGFCSDAATWTDTVTAGTVTTAAVHSLGIPTLAASSASTYTNSATLYIAGATVAGTNVTATNKYSLMIAGGNIKFGALDIVLDTTTGTTIGTAATGQKLGFFAATPIIQRTNANQAAPVGTGVTQSSPYGFATAAQGDAVVTLVTELRAALVAFGLIKGS